MEGGQKIRSEKHCTHVAGLKVEEHRWPHGAEEAGHRGRDTSVPRAGTELCRHLIEPGDFLPELWAGAQLNTTTSFVGGPEQRGPPAHPLVPQSMRDPESLRQAGWWYLLHGAK